MKNNAKLYPEHRALLESLQVGDVVRIAGRLRVVRRVKWYQPKKSCHEAKGIFWFVILKCSWTHKCYTLYSTTDLGNPKRTPIEIVARNFRPKQIIHKAIETEINTPRPGKRLLTCCDVVGLY